MKSKSEAGETLKRLTQDVGIPSALTFGGAQGQVGANTAFQKMVRKFHIKQHQNEAETQKLNRAEDCVRKINNRWW